MLLDDNKKDQLRRIAKSNCKRCLGRGFLINLPVGGEPNWSHCSCYVKNYAKLMKG